MPVSPPQHESASTSGDVRDPDPLRDPERLHLIAESGLLDSSAVARLPTLDRIARLAAAVARTPLAQVNLVTADALVPAAAFVAEEGVADAAAPDDANVGGRWRSARYVHDSICQHVVVTGQPVTISDTMLDPRTATNQAVLASGVRAYLGAPLYSPSRHVLGSICALSFTPRDWSADEASALAECAALASDEVAARLDASAVIRRIEGERAASTQLLDALLEHLPEGISIASAPDVRIQRVSRHGLELTERPPATLVGIAADDIPARWQVYHPDGGRLALPNELPLTRATLQGEVIRGEEWILRRADGTDITILCNAAPIRDDSGEITGGLIAWQDIGERKRRERALRRLQSFAVAVGSPQTTPELGEVLRREFTDVLDASALRIARRAVESPDLFEVIAADGFDTPEFQAFARFPDDARIPFADALRSGDVVVVTGLDALAADYPVLLPLAKESGYTTWLGIPLRVGSDDAPHAVGAISAALSGTRTLDADDRQLLLDMGRIAAQALERVTTLDRLRASEERVRLAVENAGLGLWSWDVRSDVARMDDRVRTILDSRVRPTEFRPNLIAERVHPDDRARVTALLSAATDPQGDGRYQCEFRVVHADGSERWVAASGHMLFSEGRTRDGASEAPARLPAFMIGVVADITERKRAEAEHDRLLDAEARARAAAEGANRAKGDFLASMSHELRTPLNAIQGHVQLVEMGLHGPVSEAQSQALARVQLASRNLLALINDVLNYAKLEAGHVQYHLAPVDLGEVVTAQHVMVDPQRLVKGQRWESILPAAPERVVADHDKLAQVLRNLYSNAVKFTPEGGSIRVRVVPGVPDESWTTVEVEDTGIGIPADRLESIFEPFVQVNPSRLDSQSGTGLGLAISRDLARGMGGELTAESEPHVGSVFRLKLRRAADH